MTSRLDSVEMVLRDDLENPLDDQPMIAQQLDQMSVIGRSVRSVNSLYMNLDLIGWASLLSCTGH